MQAPFPFEPLMLDAMLRAFGVDVTPAARAVLFATYQSTIVEWAHSQRVAAAAAAAAASAAWPTPDAHLPLAQQTIVCTWCANADLRDFVHSYEDGDVVCAKCGRVAVSNCLFEGDATRAFAAEHSDEPAPVAHASFPDARGHLFSDEYALRTMRCVAAKESGGGGGDAAICSVTLKLAYTSDAALLRGQTTNWCKDTDKQRCVQLMEDAAVKLSVCRNAVNAAVVLFARLRDSRQRVTHKRICMAASLLVCHADATWSRVFPSSTHTSCDAKFMCVHCSHFFCTPIARANHACSTPSIVRARKRKVHELDMLSFL